MLVLLRDERHEVGPAVAVEVGDRHVDRPRPRVERVLGELRRRPVGRLVLVVERAADLAEAVGGDHEVEVAVAVEVGGLHVGVAGDVLDQRARLELERARLAQPHDAALLVVGRQVLAEVGHDQVLLPVLVEVDHLRVGGVREDRDLLEPGLPLPGVAEEHGPAPHVAGHDLELAVAVEVEEADVRDDGQRGVARRAQRVLDEAQPAVVVGPQGRQRQHHGRVRLEVADDLVEVLLPQEALLARRHARAGHAPLGHLLDAEAPHAARHVLGRRLHVALRALLLDDLGDLRVLLGREGSDGPRGGGAGCGRGARRGSRAGACGRAPPARRAAPTPARRTAAELRLHRFTPRRFCAQKARAATLSAPAPRRRARGRPARRRASARGRSASAARESARTSRGRGRSARGGRSRT